MTRIRTNRSIDAPADVVWAVVTDPEVYATVAPNLTAVEIVEGEGAGMVRRCTDTDGNAWLETVTHWDEGQSFAVAVDTASSELHRRLFSRFEGEWRVSTGPEGVTVTVAFDFDTKYGPLGWLVARYFQYRAPALIEAIFDGWEAEIDSRLGAADHSPGETADPEDGTRTNQLYR
ncbi:SRPBCC family protein [Haloarchaeobius amylolyticus]|uniref:SRPBCC family protein n=1 Tax=Haloarchaeobius amylolyticus TaxID=1198296 RepID=UPI00226E1E71|nr:SRPBCC family protein [Haloarchaeobius amylolyticus]